MQRPEHLDIPSHWMAYLPVMERLGHVAVDRTAAWFHGVDAYAWADHDLPLRPETCVIGDRRATKRHSVDGGSRDLRSVDLTTVDGVAVTTPVRTALDLGCRLTRWHAYAAMNSLARVHGFEAATLCAQLPRYKGRRGAIQLRSLSGLVDPRIESPGESRVLLALSDAGLPLPTPQVEIPVRTGETFRVDFAYVRRRLAIEYDGREFHGATETQVRHDQRRRELLRDAGWAMVVVTSADFSSGLGGAWIERLRERLSDRHDNRRW